MACIYEEYKDLFSVSEDYYLAHCISADFTMGKGIAVEFCKRFDMKNRLRNKYPNYRNYYIQSMIKGDCILEDRVLNLITKERYFHKPTLDTVEIALQKMKEICIENGITKVAMPTIGAGLDGLNWPQVLNRIHSVFEELDIEILICKLRQKDNVYYRRLIETDENGVTRYSRKQEI